MRQYKVIKRGKNYRVKIKGRFWWSYAKYCIPNCGLYPIFAPMKFESYAEAARWCHEDAQFDGVKRYEIVFKE